MFHKIHEMIRMIVHIFILEICMIITFPITFLIGSLCIFTGLISIAILFPHSFYRTHKYRDILMEHKDEEICENIQYLIDFYAHHKDTSSRLIRDCVRYVDYIYQGHPQQYVKYRFEFCNFLGKICKIAINEKMENNIEVFDHLKKSGFENCRDPRKYWGTLRVDDIRIFKDSAQIDN